MSAAALTKKLLSIDFLANEANLANCLKTILQEFIDTRNPIFPRQDVLVYLLKVMVTSTNISLIKFVLAILTEFCSKSSAYDANFVKRHLINLKIVKILYCAISGSNLYNDKGLSESYLLLLSCLSDVLLPTELQITLTDLVPMCMSFCNIKERCLFSYDASFMSQVFVSYLKVKSMMINKSLVLKVQACDPGPSAENCDLMEELFGCRRLQLTHCTGNVYDTSASADLNLSKVLLDQGLVWYSGEGDSEDLAVAREPSSDEWKDIIPSQIAYGPHFFAHELDQLKQIADIELILQDEVHKSIGSAPQPGDMVTVRGPIISPHCKIEAKEIYYRAQVCRKLDKKDCYLAIALDYGQLKEIKFSMIYRPSPSLIHIMPSTTLCTLKGVQPSPYSLKLLDLSLSILQTLTVGNFTISENIVGQWSAFHVLSQLALISPHQQTCTKIMVIFTHVSLCSRVRTNRVVADEAVGKTMDLLKRFAKQGWKEAVIAACHALSAMLFDNPSASSQLEPGLESLVGIISEYEGDQEVCAAVLQTLKNYLGNQDLVSTSCEISSPRSSLASPLNTKPTDVKTTNLNSNCSKGVALTSNSSLETEERTRTSQSGCKHRQIDLEELKIQDCHGGQASQQSVVTRNSSHKDFYKLGERTTLKTSDNYSVYELDTCMNCVSVQKELMGFLNAGIEGHLVYGINSDGIVAGVGVSREKRDQLRLGLDRICQDIQPALTCNMPTLYFIPICYPDEADDDALRCYIPNRYVVEIAIQSSANDTGYTLKSDNRIFMRSGTQTVVGTTQDLRQLIISQTESYYI